MKNVDNEEYQRRIDICNGCEWISDKFICKQCHCYMKVKARWDIKNSCKLNKW